MGEIADMIIEGTLCDVCGEYMGDGDGYARRCAACRCEDPAIHGSGWPGTSERGNRKRMIRRLSNAPKPNRDVAIKRDDAWRIIDLLKNKQGDKAREDLVRCFVEAVAPQTKNAGATPAR